MSFGKNVRFWEPGGYGYVRGRPQTNPTLGQVLRMAMPQPPPPL